MLSNKVKDLLELEPKKVYVPSICFWEIVISAQKGRLKIGSERPDTFARSLLVRSGFTEVVMNSEIAILSRTLDFVHEDPADRFIAATAKHLNMPLATVDPNLTRLPWLSTIS